MAVRILAADPVDAAAVAKFRANGWEVVEQHYEQDEVGTVLKDFDAAVLVGETTYGKSVGQEVLELSGGSALVLSNVAYTPPTSPSFENVGVEPDISCKLRSENLYLISHEEDDQWLEAYHAIRNR